jgi:glycosyltransferase involved in cell wall biosynthesis
MGRRGMSRARKFSWDRAARETAQVYRRALTGK